MLDHVSQSLDPLKLWLVRLNVRGNDVELEGRAMSNDDVNEIATALRAFHPTTGRTACVR